LVSYQAKKDLKSKTNKLGFNVDRG